MGVNRWLLFPGEQGLKRELHEVASSGGQGIHRFELSVNLPLYYTQHFDVPFSKDPLEGCLESGPGRLDR